MDYFVVLLIGHSFIRRVRNVWIPSVHGQGHDLLSVNEARMAAISAGLGNVCNKLYTMSTGINLISDLIRTLETVADKRPDIVCLHVGSNDLANMPQEHLINAEYFATMCFQFALRLVRDYQVKHVILLQCLPRTRLRNGTAVSFAANMRYFNAALDEFCSTNDQIDFVGIRGFAHKKVNGVDVPRPVSEWSLDGIHCRRTYGMEVALGNIPPTCPREPGADIDWLLKYAQRVKFAALGAVAKISNR